MWSQCSSLTVRILPTYYKLASLYFPAFGACVLQLQNVWLGVCFSDIDQWFIRFWYCHFKSLDAVVSVVAFQCESSFFMDGFGVVRF